MTNDFYSKVMSSVQSSIFTDEDLKLIFSGKELHQIHNSLSYHLKMKHMIKYKRGVYSLAGLRAVISVYELASKLYGPSYISFESALSHHGLIPEAVYEVTSACFQKKMKMFKTKVGNFSYVHSPVDPFLLEVEKIDHALMATPIRALFDTIYKRKIVYREIGDLDLDLRIDLDELKNIVEPYSANDLIGLGESYMKKSTQVLAQILIRSFK